MPGPIVAGAAPEVVLGLLSLFALLAWAISRGLLAVWVHTFGAILRAMGNTLDFDIRFIHVRLGHVFFALDTTVHNALRSAAVKSEQAAGYFFHIMALIARWMAREIEQTANDVADWAEWLQEVHLPVWVKAMVYAAFPPALIARLVQAAIHANLPHVGRTVVKTVEKVTTITVNKVTHAAAGAVAIPGWAIALPGRVGGLERDLSGLRKRVRGLEKYAGATAAVALFTAALAKLGLHWLRCKNVSKAGKRLCGLDAGLLEALLAGSTLIVGTISLREFAKEMEAVTEEAAGLVRGFIRET